MEIIQEKGQKFSQESSQMKIWEREKGLVTGHTGFKGSWLTLWLNKLGAEVMGYALEPATDISLI